MYDAQVQTNKANDKQSQGQTDICMNSVKMKKGWCIISPIERYSGY